MGVGGQRHAPAALSPGKTRYPLHRRLGGLQSRSGQVRKISPPPGFDPRTVQPVASRYTDYDIPAPLPDWETKYFLWGYKHFVRPAVSNFRIALPLLWFYRQRARKVLVLVPELPPWSCPVTCHIPITSLLIYKFNAQFSKLLKF